MTTTPLPPPVPLTGLDCYIDPQDGKVKRYDKARADLEAENAKLREALERYQFIRRHSYVLRVFMNGTHGELMQPSPGHLSDEKFDAEIDKLRAALESKP